MALNVWADSAATGTNDGTSAINAFTVLQTAINGLDTSNGILHVTGTFLEGISNTSKIDATWKLYGDVEVNSSGLNKDSIITNKNIDFESEDGGEYELKFCGSDTGRDNFQSDGSVCASTTDITVTLCDGDRGLFLNGASNPSTVTFPRFKAFNHTSQVLYDTGAAEIHANLGEEFVRYSCWLEDNFRWWISNTNASSELLIYGGLIVGSTEDMIKTRASAHPVNIKQSIIFGGATDPKNITDFMVDDAAGSVTFDDCYTYYPPYGTGSGDTNLRFSGAVTETNPVLGPVPFGTDRRGGFVTLSTDDLVNIDEFLARNVICEQAGFKQTLLLDELELVTAQNWTDLNTAIAAGHSVTNHSVHEAQLGTLDSIEIEYTAGASLLTIDVDGDSLTATGGSLSLTLSSFADIAALVAAIDGTADYTASISTGGGDVVQLTNGQHIPESLADIAGQDISSPFTVQYSSTRVFQNEVLDGRTIIETNLTNYSDVSYGFVGGYRNDVYEALFNSNGYTSCRGTIVSNQVNAYSKEHYSVFNTIAFRLSDYVPFIGSGFNYELTNTEIKQKILGTCAWADYYGCVVDFYAHPESEYPLAQYQIVIDAIKESGIQQGTQKDAAQFIRGGAVESIESSVYYYITDYTASDAEWSPASLLVTEDGGIMQPVMASGY